MKQAAHCRPHHLVGRILNTIEVTESAYHELAYTRPLVEDLLCGAVRYAPPPGRVLVVGGNILLTQTLLAVGYDLELWGLGNQLLPGDVGARVRHVLTPERIAAADLPAGEQLFDVVLLPQVVEHVSTSPSTVFALFRPYLRDGGTLIATTKNLGALGLRVRAVRGHNYLPPAPQGDGAAFSLSWPALPERHYFLMEELLGYANRAGLTVLTRRFSIGRLPYHRTASFGLRGYMARMVTHAIKLVAPPLRDYSMLVLRAERAGDPESAAALREELSNDRC